MSVNENYSSKKILNKTIFNIGFQIVPIAAALILTPYLINNMGKDFWAKYATGVSLIFLSNYFSFGIGPTLNRRVSEFIGLKKYYKISNELKECISLSYLLGALFFFILHILLYLAFTSKSLSILVTLEDYIFYVLILSVFFLSFLIIPFRSLLESFSDFYFLALVRAVTASTLFIIPGLYIYFSKISLIYIGISLFLIYVLLYLLYFFRVRRHQKHFSFSMPLPFEHEVLTRLFKFEIGFIKETVWFSIFFLSSAIVLFFDRFYYPVFFDVQTISDQVTLLDLFNRIAIITGTISLIYFSAVSVWYQENNLVRIRKNLKAQFLIIGVVFIAIIFFCYFFLNSILAWWLGGSYSHFMTANAYPLLIGVLLINFTILLIRPLQAIGQIKIVSIFLITTTIIYIIIVVFLGVNRAIEYHYLAFFTKAILDMIVLLSLLKRNKIL